MEEQIPTKSAAYYLLLLIRKLEGFVGSLLSKITEGGDCARKGWWGRRGVAWRSSIGEIDVSSRILQRIKNALTRQVRPFFSPILNEKRVSLDES